MPPPNRKTEARLRFIRSDQAKTARLPTVENRHFGQVDRKSQGKIRFR